MTLASGEREYLVDPVVAAPELGYNSTN